MHALHSTYLSLVSIQFWTAAHVCTFKESSPTRCTCKMANYICREEDLLTIKSLSFNEKNKHHLRCLECSDHANTGVCIHIYWLHASICALCMHDIHLVQLIHQKCQSSISHFKAMANKWTKSISTKLNSHKTFYKSNSVHNAFYAEQCAMCSMEDSSEKAKPKQKPW